MSLTDHGRQGFIGVLQEKELLGSVPVLIELPIKKRRLYFEDTF